MSPMWSVDERGTWEPLDDREQLDEQHCYLRTGGWTVEEVDGGHAYVVPGGTSHADGGQCGVDFYWEPDEAIGIMEGG